MATSPSYPELDDKHMSGDGLELNDGKEAASQITDQIEGCGEGLLSTTHQTSVDQGDELQNNNTYSHNTHNTLQTMKTTCASLPILSTDTATEKQSWCFVGQYTEGGRNGDGKNPSVEAQEFGTGQLRFRIHNPGKPNHEQTVQWGRFVLDGGSFAAFASTKGKMLEYVRGKLGEQP